MATQIQKDAEIEQINNKLDKLFSFSIEELVKEKELGTEFSFKEIEDYFVMTIELFKKAKEINLKEAPFIYLQQFNAQLDIALNIFEQAKNFKPSVANAANVRKGIIDAIQNHYDNFKTHTIPLLTIGLLNNNDLSLERSKVNQLISELESELQKVKDDSQAKVKELKETLENAKSFSIQAGVSKHSSLFKTESALHETEASTWLKYTWCILGTIIIVAIVLAIVGLKYFNENSQILQFTITKVIILTALFYGLSLTNKNYKAHKHNALLNKHRQNALSTFETFSNASSADEQTKNAVLLETTHSIFSNQQTGYLRIESDSDSNNKIIEIIKSVTTKEQ